MAFNAIKIWDNNILEIRLKSTLFNEHIKLLLHVYKYNVMHNTYNKCIITCYIEDRINPRVGGAISIL